MVQATPGAGFAVTEYYSYTASSVGGPADIAFGVGGLFQNDLYFVDNTVRRLYRLADLDGDGDAKDPGEGTLMARRSEMLSRSSRIPDPG